MTNNGYTQSLYAVADDDRKPLAAASSASNCSVFTKVKRSNSDTPVAMATPSAAVMPAKQEAAPRGQGRESADQNKSAATVFTYAEPPLRDPPAHYASPTVSALYVARNLLCVEIVAPEHALPRSGELVVRFADDDGKGHDGGKGRDGEGRHGGGEGRRCRRLTPTIYAEIRAQLHAMEREYWKGQDGTGNEWYTLPVEKLRTAADRLAAIDGWIREVGWK